jgi:hypothetical protein
MIEGYVCFKFLTETHFHSNVDWIYLTRLTSREIFFLFLFFSYTCLTGQKKCMKPVKHFDRIDIYEEGVRM